MNSSDGEVASLTLIFLIQKEMVNIKIQKTYIGYTVLMWIVWSLIMILHRISGNTFDVQNEQLFMIIKSVSEVVHRISLVPVIPVLWIFAFIYSIKNKKYKYVVFNVVSIMFTIGLWFQYFVTHLVGIMGGA